MNGDQRSTFSEFLVLNLLLLIYPVRQIKIDVEN